MKKKTRAIVYTLTIAVSILVIFATISVNASTTESSSLPDPAYNATNPSYRISDSPYLRLSEDMKDWPPMEATGPQEVVEAEDPTALELYDILTGEVNQVSSTNITLCESCLNSTLPYEGLLPPGTVLESIIWPDDRTKVTDTSVYPWRTVCNLLMTFPDGAQGGCSGAIVGRSDGHGFLVLTAGHCIYSHGNGGWATSVKVIPGLNDDYMPYNYAWGAYLRSYTGWTVSGMTQHDWGVVTLDRSVGDFTGWMGRMTASPSNSMYTSILNTAGYPGDKGGDTMWFDWDYGHSADEYNHWYYMDTYAGQSGSPVWRFTGDSRYILTTHTCGTAGCGISGKGCNHGTRLNSDKFDRITSWVNSDPWFPQKADLIDDGSAYSGFSPTTVSPGEYFHVWNDVRNVGTAASGAFSVCYYASTNTAITTSDHLIGCDSVPSMNPFTWQNSDWSGSFPTTIPAG